jgi:hypothetical protein
MGTLATHSAGDRWFVFVVCGAQEHLDTLQVALRALTHHSKNEIVVVTDSRRNASEIDWPHVVDVHTPEHFNHHQASIYLKTGLHRHLPAGRLYCYLDTDVIAVDADVDTIFERYVSPVTFASDHARLLEFSPYALRCGCLEQHEIEAQELQVLLKSIRESPVSHDESQESISTEQADPITDCVPDAPPTGERRSVLTRLRKLLASAAPVLTGESPAGRRSAQQSPQPPGQGVRQEPERVDPVVNRWAGWQWQADRETWITPTGRDAYHLQCGHLLPQIEAKFGIKVRDENWQHWNGGVFLFGDDSHAFLEAWHRKTMAIFEDPAWRTRDQGTLIATVWEFGLENAPLLPQQFNFIADYYKGGAGITEDRVHLTADSFATICKPVFVHVMHHFGDTDWDLWVWVHERAGGETAQHPVSPRNTVIVGTQGDNVASNS